MHKVNLIEDCPFIMPLKHIPLTQQHYLAANSSAQFHLDNICNMCYIYIKSYIITGGAP